VIQGAAETLADRLRRLLRSARAIPVDPYAVAHALGVDEIVTNSQMIEDGRLERIDGHIRISLTTRGNAQRQRFTLAHELGHLLLADSGQDTIARRMRTDDDVERFCDSFAAALLLPRPLMNSSARTKPPRLDTLRELAGITNVSMAAVTVRLAETCGWRVALLHWKRWPTGWTYRWGAAVPRVLYRTLRSAPSTSDELDRLAAVGRNDQRGSVTMRSATSEIALPGEFSVFPRSALALVAFPDDRPASTPR
jgi:hypothetical protein